MAGFRYEMKRRTASPMMYSTVYPSHRRYPSISSNASSPSSSASSAWVPATATNSAFSRQIMLKRPSNGMVIANTGASPSTTSPSTTSQRSEYEHQHHQQHQHRHQHQLHYNHRGPSRTNPNLMKEHEEQQRRQDDASLFSAARALLSLAPGATTSAGASLQKDAAVAHDDEDRQQALNDDNYCHDHSNNSTKMMQVECYEDHDDRRQVSPPTLCSEVSMVPSSAPTTSGMLLKKHHEHVIMRATQPPPQPVGVPSSLAEQRRLQWQQQAAPRTLSSSYTVREPVPAIVHAYSTDGSQQGIATDGGGRQHYHQQQHHQHHQQHYHPHHRRRSSSSSTTFEETSSYASAATSSGSMSSLSPPSPSEVYAVPSPSRNRTSAPSWRPQPQHQLSWQPQVQQMQQQRQQQQQHQYAPVARAQPVPPPLMYCGLVREPDSEMETLVSRGRVAPPPAPRSFFSSSRPLATNDEERQQQMNSYYSQPAVSRAAREDYASSDDRHNRHDKQQEVDAGDADGGVDNEMMYHTGSLSLSLSDDEDFLSPLHCFLRRYCVEVFTATLQDLPSSSGSSANNNPARSKGGSSTWARHHGRVMLGQVGIRCIHCKNRQIKMREERAVCFPSSLKNIYHSIETWQRRHSVVCRDIPAWIKADLTRLMQQSKSGAGGRRQYWEESARRLGMADTPFGIRFVRTPGDHGDSDPDALSAPGLESHDSMHSSTSASSSSSSSSLAGNQSSSDGAQEGASDCGRPVVLPEDAELVTDYLFLLMEQMETCRFTEQDRSGGRSKVKDCPNGYAGMQCKHCSGKAGFGRYFPASVQALTSANSDRNVYNHLGKCRRCPPEIRQRLQQLQLEQQLHPQQQNQQDSNASGTNGGGGGGGKAIKNKRGSRKLFFQRVWNRLHEQTSQP